MAGKKRKAQVKRRRLRMEPNILPEEREAVNGLKKGDLERRGFQNFPKG